jgi:hypothetical protein
MTDRYPTPPKNLMEFAHRFATDERCAEYLFELRYPRWLRMPQVRQREGVVRG